ncbi:MAG: hypothetical protein KDK76_05480 [Chlamydiia bacterium]|nr:hypothetical protein [Chlamydiia bacterium]
MDTSYSDFVRPYQQQIFDAVSSYAQTRNPSSLKRLEGAVKSGKINVNNLTTDIQDYYINKADGNSFLKEKNVEDLTNFRSGLVALMVNVPGAKEGLTPVFDLVNQVGQQKLAPSKKKAPKPAPQNGAARISAPKPQAQTRTQRLVAEASEMLKKAKYRVDEKTLKTLKVWANGTDGDNDAKFFAQVDNLIKIASTEKQYQ